MNVKDYLESQAKTPLVDHTSNGAAALQEARKEEAIKKQNNFILLAFLGLGLGLVYLLKGGR